MSFSEEVKMRVAGYSTDSDLQVAAQNFITESVRAKYSYNFTWLGRPIIQYPQDIMAMQELIWKVKPDLIIETGIAHGGSLVFSATMLALLNQVEAIELGRTLDPLQSKRKVIGVDIDIRPHNRAEIERHPFAGLIELIQGSSISGEVVNHVKTIAQDYQKVLVCLDSNHTHDHVLSELEMYSDLVSVGSYCVVFDSVIESLPSDMFPDREWGPGNNPMTAIQKYLNSNKKFIIDEELDNKLQVSVAPKGYLKRVA